jgi:hypothetical protein
MTTTTIKSSFCCSFKLNERFASSYRIKTSLILFLLLISFPKIFLAQKTENLQIKPVVFATTRAHIEIQNPATSKGIITFSFTPKGGVKQEIIVSIKKGKKPKKIAKKIKKYLNNKLPNFYKATYRTSGGYYYVDIEKDVSTAADFDISHTMTVQGLAINVVK